MVIEHWKTTSFRTSIIEKLDQELRKAGLDSYQNGAKMENEAFCKAKTSEDYINFVGKLVLHIRDIGVTTSAASATMDSILKDKNPNRSLKNNL